MNIMTVQMRILEEIQMVIMLMPMVMFIQKIQVVVTLGLTDIYMMKI